MLIYLPFIDTLQNFFLYCFFFLFDVLVEEEKDVHALFVLSSKRLFKRYYLKTG